MTDKKLTDSEIVNNFCEVCGDNRFELIEKYKNELLEHTNIDTAKDEMAVIDSILFRFWQMDWLNSLEQFDRLQEENERLKELNLKQKRCEFCKYKEKHPYEEPCDMCKGYDLYEPSITEKEIKAEAYKEFAERLKDMHKHNTTSVVSLVTVFDNINNLLKEMVGE